MYVCMYVGIIVICNISAHITEDKLGSQGKSGGVREEPNLSEETLLDLDFSNIRKSSYIPQIFGILKVLWIFEIYCKFF